MKKDASEFYALRIERVLQYMGAHLDETLSLEILSEVAGFSKYHFHRQFRAFVGVSPHKYIVRMRLKRASLSLALSPEQSVMDVALDAGFAAPESFSRKFRDVQGQSPKAFRDAPDWVRWGEAFRSPEEVRMRKMETKIVEFESTRIAVLEHRGSPDALMTSVQKFIAWRKSSDVSPESSSMTLGLVYDDPEATEPDAFRFDICGSTRKSVPENEFGIVEKEIPGGRCVVARHLGSTDTLGKTVHALYGDWLPKSGERLRDFPLFFHYVKRMPAVSELEQVTDVYLPLCAAAAGPSED